MFVNYLAYNKTQQIVTAVLVGVVDVLANDYGS